MPEEILYIGEIIANLNNSSTVLDAGCGTGSFDYKKCNVQIIGIDINFPKNDTKINYLKTIKNVHFVKANCRYLPFKSQVFDALLYNNTLEHFTGIENCIKEANRVGNKDCYLYAAIPEGRGFDDRFYRWLYNGGGHVNQFTFDSFCKIINKFSDFKLNSFCDLNSGFTYLTPPKEVHKYLAQLPVRFFINETLQRILIWITRTSDRFFDTNLKLYGYILVFSKKEKEIIERKGFINTCRKCGSGFNPDMSHKSIKRGIFYHQFTCPSCETINEFYKG